ncbi:MAG: hypothetical protein GF307_05635, partial [candidate division Zixibacteria bacterium]|nr:hypothetical protein [candidate division Zixibacteria bacterium]
MTPKRNKLSIHVAIAAILIAAFLISAASAQVSQQWVARYGSPGTGQDYAKFVRTAPNGDVYVAGYVGTDYLRDIVMVKYNSNGVFQWDCFYDHDPWGGEFDEPNAMAVDENGYSYIAGRAGGGGSYDNEIVTIKFTPDGDTSWVRIYEGPDYGDDQAFDMVLDGEGNVYVTGWSDGGSGFGLDMVTIKYDSIGVQRWVVRYNGATNYFDSGEGIDIGNDGYIYVTGTSGVADTLL